MDLNEAIQSLSEVKTQNPSMYINGVINKLDSIDSMFIKNNLPKMLQQKVYSKDIKSIVDKIEDLIDELEELSTNFKRNN